MDPHISTGHPISMARCGRKREESACIRWSSTTHPSTFRAVLMHLRLHATAARCIQHRLCSAPTAGTTATSIGPQSWTHWTPSKLGEIPRPPPTTGSMIESTCRLSSAMCFQSRSPSRLFLRHFFLFPDFFLLFLLYLLRCRISCAMKRRKDNNWESGKGAPCIEQATRWRPRSSRKWIETISSHGLKRRLSVD